MTRAEALSIAVALVCLPPGQATTAAFILVVSAFIDSLPRPAATPSGQSKQCLGGLSR
jgi:hypothetical protein